MGRFPYYDWSLGCEVKNERERQRLMREKGLVDAEDYDSYESLQRYAERNFKDRREAENLYMDEPLARAIYQIGAGYNPDTVLAELSARLIEAQEAQSDGTLPWWEQTEE